MSEASDEQKLFHLAEGITCVYKLDRFLHKLSITSDRRFIGSGWTRRERRRMGIAL